MERLFNILYNEDNFSNYIKGKKQCENPKDTSLILRELQSRLYSISDNLEIVEYNDLTFNDTQNHILSNLIKNVKSQTLEFILFQAAMGTGKTLLALEFASMLKNYGKILICNHTLVQTQQYAYNFNSYMTNGNMKICTYLNSETLCPSCKVCVIQDNSDVKRAFMNCELSVNPFGSGAYTMSIDFEKLINFVHSTDMLHCLRNIINHRHRWCITDNEKETFKSKIEVYWKTKRNDFGNPDMLLDLINSILDLSDNITFSNFQIPICPKAVFQFILNNVDVLITTYYNSIDIVADFRFIFIDECQNLIPYLCKNPFIRSTIYHNVTRLNNEINSIRKVLAVLADKYVITSRTIDMITNFCSLIIEFLNKSEFPTALKSFGDETHKIMLTMLYYSSDELLQISMFCKHGFMSQSCPITERTLVAFVLYTISFLRKQWTYIHRFVNISFQFEMKTYINNDYIEGSIYIMDPVSAMISLMKYQKIVMYSGTIPDYLIMSINSIHTKEGFSRMFHMFKAPVSGKYPKFLVIKEDQNVFFNARIELRINTTDGYDVLQSLIAAIKSAYDFNPKGIILVFVGTIRILHSMIKDLTEGLSNNKVNSIVVAKRKYTAGDFPVKYCNEFMESNANIKNELKARLVNYTKVVVLTYVRSSLGEGYDDENVKCVITFLYPNSAIKRDRWFNHALETNKDPTVSYILDSYCYGKDIHLLYQCCGRAHRSSQSNNSSFMLISDPRINKDQYRNLTFTKNHLNIEKVVYNFMFSNSEK